MELLRHQLAVLALLAAGGRGLIPFKEARIQDNGFQSRGRHRTHTVDDHVAYANRANKRHAARKAAKIQKRHMKKVRGK